MAPLKAPVRILVTGGAGRVGTAVTAEGRARGHDVLAFPRSRLDVRDRRAVQESLRRTAPDAVVHCAAWTDVDACEGDPPRAHRVNGEGAGHVADAAAAVGARFVYLGTDYVFDGRRDTPYPVDAPPSPLSAYGRSKLEGEEAARRAGRWTIVRTSWVYGGPGGGFLTTVLSRAREGAPLRVVSDERSRPTWAPDLARALVDLVELDAGGIHHVANAGDATRIELARAALEEAGLVAPLEPVTSRQWGAPAPRPLYSVLDLSTTEEVLARPLPHWRSSLRHHLASGEDRGSPPGRADR